MSDGASAKQRLELAIAALNDTFGPSYTEEEQALTLRLCHDRGMRLCALLMNEGLTEAASPDRPERDQGSRSINGEPTWAIELAGLRIEWPARRIALGQGRYRYI